MSSRVKKWVIFFIFIIVGTLAAVVVKYLDLQKTEIPDGAALGNLDVAMAQIEPEIIRSLWNDQTAESTTIYIFRPDGGMSIGSLDLAVSGGFYIPEPGNVYFIKDDKIYCCSVVGKNWKVTDRKSWQAFAIFELRDGIPYIDDNYAVNFYDHPIIAHEDIITWNDLIAQVNEKIAAYENSR